MKRSQRIIHLVATVPSGHIVHRAINKLISKSGVITPLYRYGNESFLPWKKPCRGPHHVSRAMLHHFKKFGEVRYYNIYEKGVIDLGPDDIFIGQPVPHGGFSFDGRPDRDEFDSISSTTFRKNKNSNKNKLLIIPYANDEKLMHWARDLVLNYADKTILIGGDIWTKDVKNTPFGELDRNRFLRIDNAVDVVDYPEIKKKFNLPGKRRFLYIGHTGWYKNTAELERIAKMMPDFHGTHLGQGIVNGWDNRGYASFDPDSLTKIADEHDIFVTVSSADAQATTILENICFGFPIACTPETGYEHPSIVKLHINNTVHNVRALTSMQNMDELTLRSLVEENRKMVNERHLLGPYVKKISDFIGCF